MSDDMDESEFAGLLDRYAIQGSIKNSFDIMGQPVVFDLFPVGTREKIERNVSGLDGGSREFVSRICEVAYSLFSVGGYVFKGDNERFKFVRSMKDPVFLMFEDVIRAMRSLQSENFVKMREMLKKTIEEVLQGTSGD